ncbi:MAG: GNAT family N-acetyltransferase [[Clostridium] leptum]
MLGAIAVTPQSRGRGLGSAVVLHLLEQLEGKRVYLFRSNGKNEKFYQRLGFTHRTYFKEGTGTDVRIFSHRS